MKRSASENPVAKYAHRFNKSVVYKDRKKALKRGQVKHKKQVYQAAA